jgi:hypothetical protein
VPIVPTLLLPVPPLTVSPFRVVHAGRSEECPRDPHHLSQAGTAVAHAVAGAPSQRPAAPRARDVAPGLRYPLRQVGADLFRPCILVMTTMMMMMFMLRMRMMTMITIMAPGARSSACPAS